jgi:hypothetical protein
MCYNNCPYENNKGECRLTVESNRYPADAHCEVEEDVDGEGRYATQAQCDDDA